MDISNIKAWLTKGKAAVAWRSSNSYNIQSFKKKIVCISVFIYFPPLLINFFGYFGVFPLNLPFWITNHISNEKYLILIFVPPLIPTWMGFTGYSKANSHSQQHEKQRFRKQEVGCCQLFQHNHDSDRLLLQMLTVFRISFFNFQRLWREKETCDIECRTCFEPRKFSALSSLIFLICILS